MARKRYWIKLWIDFLNDIKVGMLPEPYQLRFVKLCLIAGEVDKDGKLPGLPQTSFALRLSADVTQETLDALVDADLINIEDGVYSIANFEKRQSPMTSTERVKRFREKAQRGNENVSITGPEGETKPDFDLQTAFVKYEQEIGMITPLIAEDIFGYLGESVPVEWIVTAIDIASRNNKRAWSYVTAIIERWRKDGFSTDKRLTAQEKGTLEAITKELKDRGYAD